MKLKKRLIFANAATAVIPLIITALLALAYLFIYGKFYDINLSFNNYQKLSHIKSELSGSGGVLQQNPDILKDKDFQNYLTQVIAGIGGEAIVFQNDIALYSSRTFTKIEQAKILEALKRNQNLSEEPLVIGNISYTVEQVEAAMKDGYLGRVVFLVPLGKNMTSLSGLFIIMGAAFFIFFLIMNVAVSRLLSRTVINPLNSLKKAAAEIKKGNLDWQIYEEGDHEIQELCRDLELMRLRLKNSINTQLKYEDNRKMLISSISHDLKTPVTAIKGYVEGILDGIAQTPEKKEKYLKTIYTKAQQIDEMIDDLLLYAKLDMNQLPFNFEKTCILEFFQDCLLENEPDLERSGIKIGLSNELSRKYEVFIDRERMKRVITNILDNARKYMDKEEKEIRIILRETRTSIIIEVRDNGRGIKKEDLSYIFDRFYRSDAARGETEGSGLGLAIAKQIIEGHNGTIWALTHGEEGTSIMISLNKGH